MAVPFFKIYYTPPSGDEVDITDSVRLDQKRGLDLKSGSCRFTVKNSPFRDKTSGESIFKEDGAVEVYADYSPITRVAGQLLISGNVRELKPRFEERGSSYEINVGDRTVHLLGFLWPGHYSDTKIDEIIKNVVSHASENVNQKVTTNNVVSTTTAGSAFPITDYSQTFKPVVEWVSDLSQPEFTGEDRAYMFYVDTDNDLHWFYPSQTSSGTIVEGSDDLYSMRMTRNADDMVNMIIFNAGADLNGNGKLGYDFDATSKSTTLRMKYHPLTDISPQLFDAEISLGNLTESSDGTVPYKGKLYTAVASGTTAWGAAFADFDAYNDTFRDQLESLGKAQAGKILRRFGKLLWKGSATMKGTNSYVAGDLVDVISATIGLNNYKLRVHDVQHALGMNGWITVLELKEDEEAVTASEE